MFRSALLASSALSAAAQTVSTGYQGYAWTIDGVPIIPNVAIREDSNNMDSRFQKSVAQTGFGDLGQAAVGFGTTQFATPFDTTRITVPLAMGKDNIDTQANAGVTFTVTGHSFPFDEQPAGSAYWERRPVFVLRQCATGTSDTDYFPRGRDAGTPDENSISGADTQGGGSQTPNERYYPCTCAESEVAQDNQLVVTGTGVDDGLALQVIPTSATTGTITLSPGNVATILTTVVADGAGGADALIAATEGMESDWILCGQSETRKHTHPILSALDVLNDGDASCTQNAQPCEVPPARGKFVAGVDTTVDGLWVSATSGATMNTMLDSDVQAFRVANGILLQFRRSCASDLECIQRAEDGDPANDVDRENYLNVWQGRYRRTCRAVPPGPSGQNRGSICVNDERDSFCGQALFNKLNEKCCSSNTETGSGHVYPAELANARGGSPRVVSRDPWACPCTAGDSRDALGALSPAITHPASNDGFDLGADVTCGRDGEACCAYTKYSELANAAPVAEVNPGFLGVNSFDFADFLCNAGQDAAAAGDAVTAAANQRLGCANDRTYGISWALGNDAADAAATALAVPALALVVPDFPPRLQAAPGTPNVATESLSALRTTDVRENFVNPDLYKFGSVAYPYYSCYNTQYRSCCDDGTVYDPATAQCCPITGVQPQENPCPCVNDGDCSAGKTCCTQTSPPPVREAYLNAQCSKYANHQGTGTDLQERWDTDSGSNLGGLLTASVPLTDRLYFQALRARGPEPLANAAQLPISMADTGSTLEIKGVYAAIDTHFLHPADERLRNKNAKPYYRGTGFGSISAATFESPLDWAPAKMSDGGVCPGKCIDPSWQLCCNGAVCHEAYESCCNTTCCNKKSQGCVSGGQLPQDAHGIHTITGNSPFFSRAATFLKANDLWVGYEASVDYQMLKIQNPFSFFSSLDSQGRSQWTWTANNLGQTYDVCTEIEYLSPVKAFWVFVLPTFLMVFTVAAVFVVATFVNAEANKNEGEGFRFYDKWVLGLATLQAVFVLPTYFSPQWVYGLVVVLASAFGLVAFASRSRYLKTVFVVLHVVVLVYLIDPFAGNEYFNLTQAGGRGLVPSVLGNWATYDRFNQLDRTTRFYDFGAYYGVVDGDAAGHDQIFFGTNPTTGQGTYSSGGPQINVPGHMTSPWFRMYHNTEPFLNENVFRQQNYFTDNTDTYSFVGATPLAGQCSDVNGATRAPGIGSPWETPGDYCLHGLLENHDFYGGHTHLTATLAGSPTSSWNNAYANPYLQAQSQGQQNAGDATNEVPPKFANGQWWTDRTSGDPVCGNGIVEAPEQCDDGNQNGGDGCDEQCRISGVNGDLRANPFGLTDIAASANPFASGCTTYYDYFELDARLLDLDRQANHDERFFGYCSRGWTVFLAITSGLVIMLALVLLVIAILTLILSSIEESTPAKSSAFVHGPLPEVPAIYAQ